MEQQWVVELTPPAERELLELPKDLLARIEHVARLLEAYGPERVREPQIKPLEQKLWEMRL